MHHEKVGKLQINPLNKMGKKNMNIIMNSISKAHLNKRIMDFECLGFNINVFGFTQKHHFSSKERHFNRGNFTYISQYYKRIITYINRIRMAF